MAAVQARASRSGGGWDPLAGNGAPRFHAGLGEAVEQVRGGWELRRAEPSGIGFHGAAAERGAQRHAPKGLKRRLAVHGNARGLGAGGIAERQPAGDQAEHDAVEEDEVRTGGPLSGGQLELPRRPPERCSV